MNLSLYIAGRYLFSKKSHQVINIISAVAIAGIALATAAMICALSVFNGFQGLVEKQFTAFDPDIKITAAKGKSFLTDTPEIEKACNTEGVEMVSFSVEDNALIEYNGRQTMAVIKGIDSNFEKLTNIKGALHGNGEFILEDSICSYAVMGGELVNRLGCGLMFSAPLEVFAPNRNSKINLTMPAKNFKKGKLYSSGLAFIVNQPRYDAGYILVSNEFARKIFRRKANEATSLQIKLLPGADGKKAKRELEAVLGSSFTVQDRYEQQNDVYKVMQIEKLLSYILLTFILLVACFNIVGSLSMLIIEKRDNMNTLRSLGAENRTIANIFVYEGMIISAIGAVTGIAAGVALCLAQQQFGIISMGGGGNFVVDSYPMEIEAGDVMVTFATVIAAGIAAVWLPVKILTRKFV